MEEKAPAAAEAAAELQVVELTLTRDAKNQLGMELGQDPQPPYEVWIHGFVPGSPAEKAHQAGDLHKHDVLAQVRATATRGGGGGCDCCCCCYVTAAQSQSMVQLLCPPPPFAAIANSCLKQTRNCSYRRQPTDRRPERDRPDYRRVVPTAQGAGGPDVFLA